MKIKTCTTKDYESVFDINRKSKSYRIGELLNISSKRYTVTKIPNIDYSRTYLPFSILVRNGFLKEINYDTRI